MAAPTNPGPLTIKEDQPNGLTVELKDTDLPFGFPRELTAFETGGKTQLAEDGELRNPGADQPVVQVMNTNVNRPMVLKGAFRDRQWGIPGHARNMRNLLEYMRQRANPVRISWESDERIGVLWETKWGEQGVGDIEYELTFFIAVGVDGNIVALNDAAPQTSSIENLRAQMADKLATQQHAAAKLATTVAVQAILTSGWDSINSALDAMGTATAQFEATSFATPQHAIAAANRVVAAAESVRANADAFQTTLEQIRADGALVTADALSSIGWWSMQYSAESYLNELLDAMRTIRSTAIAEVRQATRLYRVQPGDTLELIAQTQLGNRARVLDLGLRSDQLVAGKWVRIPEAK